MTLQSRPVTADDIKTLCSFVLDARELFYMFPKAQYPLTEAQLADAIAQRFDSTVVEAGKRVVGFANFYRAETGGVCCIGNVIVAQEAREFSCGSDEPHLSICVAVERAVHRSASRLLTTFSNQPQHATMRPTPALGSASVDTGEAERKPSKERP